MMSKSKLYLMSIFIIFYVHVSSNVYANSILCSDIFTQFSSINNKNSDLTKALVILESHFLNFPIDNKWISNPQQDLHTQEWVNALVSLNAVDRRTIQTKLTLSSKMSNELKFITNLALYDYGTWHSFFDSFTSKSLLNDSLINSLVPVLRNMPNELVESLYRRIGPIYSSLSKINRRYIPFRIGLRLAPKRSVDAFIRNTIKVDQQIKDSILKGATPMEAYSKHFSILKKRIFKNNSICNYDVNDVLAVAEIIQEVLRGQQHSNIEGELIMVGSLPNGRADFELSDVDLIVSNSQIKSLFTEMEIKANTKLQSKYAHVNLKFHPTWDVSTPNFIADINPIQIRISKNEIKLIVYGSEQILSYDKDRLPFNYSNPDVYTLSNKKDEIAQPSLSHENWLYSRGSFIPLEIPLIEPDKALLAAKEFLKNGYKGISIYDQSNIITNNDIRVKELINIFLNIDETDKKYLIMELEKKSIINSKINFDLQQIIELALFKDIAWNNYYEDLQSRPQQNQNIYDSFVPFFTMMPNRIRRLLMNRIQNGYSKLSSKKWVWEVWPFKKNYLNLAPKRSIDILIRNLLPPDPFIKNEVSHGINVKEAYSNYLKVLKTSFFSMSSNGDYSVEVILDIAKEIQKVLRENIPIEGQKESYLMITGSLPNGRANLNSSDIDMIPSSIKLEDLYIEIQERLKLKYLEQFPNASFEIHSMFSSTTPVFASIVNPIMIKISSEAIELIVYPIFRPIPGDQHFLQKNYLPPNSYKF